MTNDTAPHENGVADKAAIAAITSTAAETATETETPAAAPKAPSFDDLGLHPDIKQALDDMGYFEPTPVQSAVYKPVSEGKDLMVQARTGTGKTTAFGLPTLSKVVPTHRHPQALILAPTRELALQVARELTQIGKHRGIIVETLYGGAPIGKQIENLRNGVHIVVGTPGRVLDHLKRRTLDPKTITTFILDECDEMLSMGFLEDIERVVAQLPEKKQTLLFSATMPDEVSRYARRHMVNPENMSLSRDSSTVSDIHHAYYIVSGIARSRDLLKILYAEEPESAIIFCNMRDETTMVARFLQKQGLDAEPLSSDLSQNDRERVMARMKAKNLRFLCATDVAARGIDITSLSHVINYSVPESPEVYVHRTGRTGRAGKKGTALSMVGPRELGNFRYVRLQFGLKPEERLLPKDDIFVGKLKTPLPPIGIPQPPDPVQILIRGVTNTPSELEMKIFEKLYTTQSGKRVLAALVAERLDKLSTKAKPKRERSERPERTEGEGHAPAPFEARPEGDRGERPRRFDRDGERGDRPRRFDRDDRGPRPEGDRPRFDADRGPRPEGGAEGDRGDRPRRFDRDDRGPRPEGDRPRRFDRDDRGPRAEGDRERRPWRDRDDRGPRPEGRPEGRPPEVRTDAPVAAGADDAAGEAMTTRIPVIPVVDATAGEGTSTQSARPEGGERQRRDYRDRMRSDRPEGDRGGERTDRGERPEGDRSAGGEQRAERPAGGEHRGERGDRDRGDRGGRDRDRDRGGRDRDRDRSARGDAPRGPRDEAPRAPREEAPVAVAGTEAAPAVEVEVEATTQVTKVDDVARAAVERSDRNDRNEKKGGKRGTKSEPTAETREFWETWAEEKSTRPAPAEVAPAATAAAEPAAEDGERGGRGRGGRDRGGRGGRGRGGDKERTERTERTAKAEPAAEKSEKPAGRTKRDTEIAPPPAGATTGDASQARLFVSLGKKHGVSADDLRGLLAAPIGGDKARIGSVSLRDSHAHVRVPEDLVETIISAVHGTQHNDQAVTVERARA